MDEFTFCLRGDPVANERHRDARVRTRGGGMMVRRYTPEQTIQFRVRVLLEARRARGYPAEPWTGPIGIHIDAYFDRPERLLKPGSPADRILMDSKPDFDNLAKGILDGLTPKRAKRKTGFADVDAQFRAARQSGYPWVDDCQVHCEGVWRWYVAMGSVPGLIVRIRRLRQDGQPLSLQEAGC